jgi:hypothetical protein
MAFRNRRKAINDLVRYLREQEGYCGPEDLPGICDWLAEHKERLGADIFPASADLS